MKWQWSCGLLMECEIVMHHAHTMPGRSMQYMWRCRYTVWKGWHEWHNMWLQNAYVHTSYDSSLHMVATERSGQCGVLSLYTIYTWLVPVLCMGLYCHILPLPPKPTHHTKFQSTNAFSVFQPYSARGCNKIDRPLHIADITTTLLHIPQLRIQLNACYKPHQE